MQLHRTRLRDGNHGIPEPKGTRCVIVSDAQAGATRCRPSAAWFNCRALDTTLDVPIYTVDLGTMAAIAVSRPRSHRDLLFQRRHLGILSS
jgi:hypothetical protein